MATSRFLHPYYVLNFLLLIAYVALRKQRLSGFQLSQQDMFGVSRESQIYLCLALMLITRALSAPTVDAYISSAFNFSRVTVLACLFYMQPVLAAVFLSLWLVIYAVCPQPRYRLPDSVATLTTPSLHDRVTRNHQRVIHIVWCHAPWSTRCAQLTSVFASLAQSFDHPRVRFSRIDVAKFGDAADELGVSTSAMSKQLPCVIAFKQGREVARIPVLDPTGKIPKDCLRGFNTSQVTQRLDIPGLHKTAMSWEREAQIKYQKKDS